VKKAILGIATAICVVTACVSAYFLIDYYREAKESEDAFERLRPNAGEADQIPSYSDALPSYMALKEQNGDFTGWLYIVQAGVNYPVMHTPKNQDYYLRRDFEKKYSEAGTLFAGAPSDPVRPTDVTVIYGHNMNSGAMFGKLDVLDRPEYLEKEGLIIFDTLESRSTYRLIGLAKVKVDERGHSDYEYYLYGDFADESDYTNFIENFNSREIAASGVTPVYGDKLLMLSTCEYSQENGRFVALAVRTDVEYAAPPE
jgi:sortase B